MSTLTELDDHDAARWRVLLTPSIARNTVTACTRVLLDPASGFSLYLGNANAARDVDFLRTQSIGAIVNCTAELELEELPPGVADALGVQCHAVHMLDVDTFDARDALRAGAELINAARVRGRNVLVHCKAGMSRSVAVVGEQRARPWDRKGPSTQCTAVIHAPALCSTLCARARAVAYLVKHCGKTLADAWHHVKTLRPIALPNVGLFRQLIRLERELTGQQTIPDLALQYHRDYRAPMEADFESPRASDTTDGSSGVMALRSAPRAAFHAAVAPTPTTARMMRHSTPVARGFVQGGEDGSDAQRGSNDATSSSSDARGQAAHGRADVGVGVGIGGAAVGGAPLALHMAGPALPMLAPALAGVREWADRAPMRQGDASVGELAQAACAAAQAPWLVSAGFLRRSLKAHAADGASATPGWPPRRLTSNGSALTLETSALSSTSNTPGSTTSFARLPMTPEAACE